MSRFFQFICTLYLLSLPFTKEMGWPEGLPLTLPELVFLFCLPVGLFLFFRSRPPLLRWLPIDTVLVVVLGITIVAATIHPTVAAWKEVAVRGYLLLVYGLTRLAIASAGTAAVCLKKNINLLSWVAVGTVAVSWLLWFFYQGAGLELTESKYIPGRGMVWRMEAFTMSPNQLASLLSFCALMVLGNILERREKAYGLWSLFILLNAALISTLSKSLVLYAAALCVLITLQFPLSLAMRRGLRLAAAAAVVFFMFNTSFLVLRKEAPDLERVLEQNYATGRTAAAGSAYLLAETTNIRLKKVALRMFGQHPLTGIGPGSFKEALPGYQERGLYPRDKPLYDAHSVWFGSLAELGLAGFLTLAILFAFLLRAPRGSIIHATLFVFFLQLAAEGWAMDILNFRHFWVAIGIFIQLDQTSG